MVGQAISHYMILEKLGEGGMGVVYKAEDTILNRIVALKFLPASISGSEEEKARFIQEARAASALNHPNVCTIYGIDEAEGRQFIEMEFIDGVTLSDKIASERRPGAPCLSIKQAVTYAVQIAEALNEAHSKGIVHRDIKSENIMVNSKDQIKVMDFGLAKLKDSVKITRTSSTIGTLAYMSPEQIQGADADARSDIFSFGVVVFEMVTGRMPFRGEHEAAIMYSIVNEEPEDASKFRDDIPPELTYILKKTLEKDPADRYQSMAEVIVDLRRLRKESTRVIQMQPQQPVASQAAAPVSTAVAPHAAKWRPSRTVMAALGAAVVLIALLVAFWRPLTSRFGAQNEKKVIVVLPFENLGPADKEYFVDGMTDEVSSRLSGLSGLSVIARSGAMQYKKTAKTVQQIGAELGVTYILQGTVRWETLDGETHVRVNPTLIRVDDGTQAWSGSMESVLSSAFKLQSDIAARVAGALDVALGKAEKKTLETALTENSQAYDQYLRAVEYSSRSESRADYQIGIQLLERAVELDPSFAAAYAKMADLHANMYWFFYDRSEARVEKARQAAEKALALAPNLSEAHEAMGWYYYHGRLDYARALDEFSLALKYRPSNSNVNFGIAAVKRRMGDEVGAEESFKQAIAGNPRAFDLIRQLAETQALLREYQQADETYAKASELAPEISVLYLQRMISLLAWKGDIDGARRLLADAERLGRVDEDWRAVTYMRYYIGLVSGDLDAAAKAARSAPDGMVADNQFRYMPASLVLGEIEHARGNEAAARKFFDKARAQIEQKVKESPDDERLYSALGIAYAGLGKKAEAERAGLRATELLPVSKEAWRGSSRLIELAQIYTMTGAQEKAVDVLEKLLSIPSEMSAQVLKLEPWWAPLRSNARFKKLVAEGEQPAT